MQSSSSSVHFLILGVDWAANGFSLRILLRTLSLTIEMSRAEIEGTTFRDSYSAMIRGQELHNDPSSDTSRHLTERVVEICHSTIETLARLTGEGPTLQDCYCVAIYILRLTKLKDRIEANVYSGPTQTRSYYMTSVEFKDLQISADVTRYNAEDVLVVSTCETNHDIPELVLSDNGSQYYFKPCFEARTSDCIREIGILTRIEALRLHRRCGLSRLRGLVCVEDGKKVIGMLLDWIDGTVLATAASVSSKEDHARWKQEIKSTVDNLHKNNIIWGDINLHNVMIDSRSNLLVIDFGGNCNVDFVDQELCETMAGDEQGLHRLFEWLDKQ